MKLKNTTNFDDMFLRRMTVWISKTIDLPVRAARAVEFRNAARRTSGTAWPWRGEIVVRLRTTEVPEAYEYTAHGIKRRYSSRLELLVGITAHELAHLRQWVERGNKYDKNGSVEPEAERACVFALDAFRSNHDELLAEWGAPTKRKPTKPKPSAAQRREGNIRKKLTEWESKAKRAKNRVAHYRKKAQYYDRKAASRAEKGGK